MICLDVLRAMQREPDAFAALRGELAETTGSDARYDALVSRIDNALAAPQELEMNARRVVEDMALALQASLMIQNGDGAVRDAFLASRLDRQRYACFGALPHGTDAASLIGRAIPS